MTDKARKISDNTTVRLPFPTSFPQACICGHDICYRQLVNKIRDKHNDQQDEFKAYVKPIKLSLDS